VELRPSGTGGAGSNFRQWWGQVDFTGWQLRVGQQSVIDGLFPPGCCIDEGSVQSAFGGWSGRVRQPGLAAFIPIGNGTLKFGLFDPGNRGSNGSRSLELNPALAGFSASTDEQIPQIQASYDIKFGPAAVKVVGGYNTYDEVYWSGAGATSDTTTSIDSFVFGAQVEANFGPLTVMWQAHYAQNPTAYRSSGGGLTFNVDPGTGELTPLRIGGINPTYDPIKGDIQDVNEIGSFARLLYKMSDMVTWELGGGYSGQEMDYALGKIKDQQYFAYLNAQIFLTKTFRFTPEVGYFDNGHIKYDDDPRGNIKIDQGNVWYWGAYWRIDF
jgi:hypothetical protein